MGDNVLVMKSASNGGGGAIRSNGENGHAAEDKVQWARGKAGEDRVHVVVSEERGWMFVGIYDGFNGPDATDFLVSNLYAAVHRELRGLLWEQSQEDQPGSAPSTMAPDHQDQCTRRRRARRAGGRGVRRSAWSERSTRFLSAARRPRTLRSMVCESSRP